MTSRMNSNGLKQFCKQHEMSRLGEDLCYLQRQDYDSRRPFGWQTYNYHPYDGSKVVAPCHVGQFYRDGYGVGGQQIESENKVKLHPGNVLTNPRLVQKLDAFHIQMPRIRGYFDSDTESNLRPEAIYNSGACSRTTEKSYMPYSFQYFDHLCYDPQDTMYIIEEDTFNQTYPNASMYHRAGEETRHDRQEAYRNGCDWKAKVYQPGLSNSIFGN